MRSKIKMKLYQDKNWLYQKYSVEKLPMIKMARLCECSESTIFRYMKINGIKTRPNSQNGFYKYKFWLKHKYCEERLSMSQIAILCGACSPRIWYWMKKFGIKSRKLSESIKMAHNRPEVKKRIIEAQRIAFNRPEVKDKMSKANKKNWTNPEYIKKTLKARRKKPSKPEKIFNKMTPSCVYYVGNRAWWRKLNDDKYHNPDFKITGQNKVIEIFGDYWHDKKYFPETLTPRELIDLYAQAGLDCLVFWQREIYENSEQVREKVNNFIISGLL